MMIPMGELLAKAKKEGYGVAAPNVFNRETIEACFLAAKKLRAPIILDVAAVHGIYECADIARYYEKQYPEVPFALNLDHGGAYEDIVKAIQKLKKTDETETANVSDSNQSTEGKFTVN